MFDIKKVIDNLELSGTIYLVDLAGSEKLVGDPRTQQEGTFINKSLTALGNCMKQMAENKHTSFRSHLLTKALKPCFEGTCCQTTILINVGMTDKDGESVKSMRFGQNARLVKTRPAPKKSLKVEK